jgi:hypothetical protein
MGATQHARDVLFGRIPRWLSGFFGSRLFFAINGQLDSMGDALVASIKLRKPGLYSPSTLPRIGRDRRMTRTPSETDAAYAIRCQQWRQIHARRGNPFALMEQVQGQIAPDTVRLAVVSNNGNRLELSESGEPSVIGATSWDWDGDEEKWSRVWLLVYDSAWVSDGLWGDSGDWGDDPEATIGSDATIVEVARVRDIANEWGAAHAVIVHVVIVLDETAWEAAQPDGGWVRFGDRNSNVAYWKGTGA